MARIARMKDGVSTLAKDWMMPMRDNRLSLSRLEAAHERVSRIQDKIVGTLAVRSSDSAGMAALAGGHGILTGRLFDLRWDGGQRVGLVAGDVENNNVPFTGGTGDNLPAQDAAIEAVHYTTLANEMKIVDAAGNISPDDAQFLFNESAAYLAAIAPATKQAAASIVSYNGS